MGKYNWLRQFQQIVIIKKARKAVKIRKYILVSKECSLKYTLVIYLFWWHLFLMWNQMITLQGECGNTLLVSLVSNISITFPPSGIYKIRLYWYWSPSSVLQLDTTKRNTHPSYKTIKTPLSSTVKEAAPIPGPCNLTSHCVYIQRKPSSPMLTP